MQRQAVPLLRAEAPLVGTGIEGVVHATLVRRLWRNVAVSLTRSMRNGIVIRATSDLELGDAGVDIIACANSNVQTKTHVSTSAHW